MDEGMWEVKQSEYEFLTYTPHKRIITAQSTRACFILNAHWHAFPADMYSASVVEITRAACFLENHDMRQHPMNMHILLVLLRSTQSPAWSESA
ncbi:hypothetical protein Tco_0531092 [Tanacetum coccineum]